MMPASGPRPGQVAVQVSLAAIFVSLELSRSTWLITSLVPGGGDKMSKHSVRSGDIAELMIHFAKLRDKAHARAGASFPIIVIQEAGLDGFLDVVSPRSRTIRPTHGAGRHSRGRARSPLQQSCKTA